MCIRGNRWHLPDLCLCLKLGRSFGGASSHMYDVQWLEKRKPLASQALKDPEEGFLSKARLGRYESLRNKPSENALSNLSAYFHFGQLAPQRASLEAAKHRSSAKVCRGRAWPAARPSGRRHYCHETSRARTWQHVGNRPG